MKTKWQVSFLETRSPAHITGIMMNINQFISRFKVDLDKRESLTMLSKILFPTYMAFSLWVIIFKCNWIDDMLFTHDIIKNFSFYQRVMNLAELEGVIYSIKNCMFFDRRLLEPFLNVVIFVPIGLYLAFFLKNNRSFNTFVISFAMSFSFEMIQLVTLIGGFSYLDLLTNTLGGIIGYYIYKLIYREKNIRGLNIASIIMILLFVPIVVFAAINTLINIEIYIDIVLRKI